MIQLYIYTDPLFFRLFSHMLLQNIELVFLSTVGGGIVTESCPTLVTPWTVAHQVSLSMGFSRKEDWSVLPFPSPGDLPNPGTIISFIPGSLLHCRQSLSTEPPSVFSSFSSQQQKWVTWGEIFNFK